MVSHCLHQERSLIQKAEMVRTQFKNCNLSINLFNNYLVCSWQQMTLEGSSSGAISTSDAAYHIQQQLNELKKSTQECGLEIERTRQMQETHSLNFYKHHQISGKLSMQDVNRVDGIDKLTLVLII